jgi:heme oxygenase (mycobilin-producing)
MSGSETAKPVNGTLAWAGAAHTTSAIGSSVLEDKPPALDADFVVISKFTVANGMIALVKESFRNRPHKVDDADGFRRMEVISPMDDLNEIWLITFWRDEASFTTWHHSHLYRESHAGIPRGLKLVPHSTGIRRFEGVSR